MPRKLGEIPAGFYREKTSGSTDTGSSTAASGSASGTPAAREMSIMKGTAEGFAYEMDAANIDSRDVDMLDDVLDPVSGRTRLQSGRASSAKIRKQNLMEHSITEDSAFTKQTEEHNAVLAETMRQKAEQTRLEQMPIVEKNVQTRRKRDELKKQIREMEPTVKATPTKTDDRELAAMKKAAGGGSTGLIGQIMPTTSSVNRYQETLLSGMLTVGDISGKAEDSLRQNLNQEEDEQWMNAVYGKRAEFYK